MNTVLEKIIENAKKEILIILSGEYKGKDFNISVKKKEEIKNFIIKYVKGELTDKNLILFNSKGESFSFEDGDKFKK
jgi:hypothetical protein